MPDAQPRRRDNTLWWLLAAIAVISYMVYTDRASSPPAAPADSASPTTVSDGSVRHTVGGAVGCLALSTAQRVREFYQANDPDALAKFVATGNACVVLKDHLEVIFEGRPATGIVQFRLRGETASMYSIESALAP